MDYGDGKYPPEHETEHGDRCGLYEDTWQFHPSFNKEKICMRMRIFIPNVPPGPYVPTCQVVYDPLKNLDAKKILVLQSQVQAAQQGSGSIQELGPFITALQQNNGEENRLQSRLPIIDWKIGDADEEDEDARRFKRRDAAASIGALLSEGYIFFCHTFFNNALERCSHNSF